MPAPPLIRLLRLAAPSLLTGCVLAYQPMSGLHRPIAVDPAMANLAGLAVDLRCLGPGISDAEAGDLCQKVARLFENQGATVRAVASRRAFDEGDAVADPSDGATSPEAGKRGPRLTVELSSRRVHEEESTVLWLWSYVSGYTIAQDVVVRDETGFLLARETLTGRFRYRAGFTSDTDAVFSKDLYGQLSQIALNARVRRQVLSESRVD